MSSHHKFDLFPSAVTLEIRARSPKPNQVFNHPPNVISMQIWFRFHITVKNSYQPVYLWASLGIQATWIWWSGLQLWPFWWLSASTHSLLVAATLSSADSLCKQFGPGSGLTFCRSWSGSKLFDTPILFLKEFIEKIKFEKKCPQTTTKAWKITQHPEITNSQLMSWILHTVQLNLSLAVTQKKTQKYVFKTNNRFMHVKSIAEYFCNNFDLHLATTCL